ncbi:MAG: (2Fe-2S)-binding protein [Gammaproteobacteria bacterium]|nr:(2Fe-2S)-binding protein [Gammaproteobacteria bacterium]
MCEPGWHGFILSRRGILHLKYAAYWARSRGKGLWRYEIAGLEQPADWAERARSLLCSKDEKANWIEYFDTAQTHYRAARFSGEKLESCLFIGPDSSLPSREWLISLFQKDQLSQQERASILTGEPPVKQEDTGKIICSCFNVGEKTILAAITGKDLSTTNELGEQLQAGTNCGSCVPELQEMIDNCQQSG